MCKKLMCCGLAIVVALISSFLLGAGIFYYIAPNYPELYQSLMHILHIAQQYNIITVPLIAMLLFFNQKMAKKQRYWTEAIIMIVALLLMIFAIVYYEKYYATHTTKAIMHISMGVARLIYEIILIISTTYYFFKWLNNKSS